MNIFKSKVAYNACWIIFGRIAQMAISFLVSLITARYLGPNNFGLINYATAYISLFSSLCNLGINSILVKELLDKPDQEGETLGTTLGLKCLSSIASIITIIFISSIVDRNDPITIKVVILCSTGMVFQVFTTFEYWFQAKLKSKITAAATLCAYIIVSLYRITLLVLKKDVIWFAFSTAIDYLFIAVFLYIIFVKSNGPKLNFSWLRGKEILSKSYHFILSGIMVAIYGSSDKFMIKLLLGNQSEVGYYATSIAICATWTFLLTALIDSFYPTIMELFNEDRKKYIERNKLLYAIIFYISLAVSLTIIVFAEPIINILYGHEYLPAAKSLRIVTCYTAFSYLGVARNAWIVCENKQKYLKYIYVLAAAINVLLNFILIPYYGSTGAALSSLITQILTCLILPLFWKDLRENSKMMIEALLLKIDKY